MTFRVPVTLRNRLLRPDDIQYRSNRYPGTQVRCRDRFVLTPDIEFDRYRCGAVIDWITLSFSIKKATQFQYLRRFFETAGTSAFVKPLEDLGGKTAKKFSVKIQQPKISAIRDAFSEIETRYNLRGQPIITEIEVSIDFYSKTDSEEERLRMVHVLTRHHHVADVSVISNKWERPRCVCEVRDKPSIGSAEKKRPDTETVWLLKSSRHPRLNRDEFPQATELDQASYADGTYYVGKKGADRMWRIMHKTIDQQNLQKGTRTELESHKRRARIEVTLKGKELEKLKISTLDDLTAIGMMKFKRYFTFMLPTFSETDRPTGITTLPALLSRGRWDKFRLTGVFGLHWMDQARYKLNREIKRLGISRGYPLKPYPRRGAGTSSMLVSYTALNKRVETALRHLTESVRR